MHSYLHFTAVKNCPFEKEKVLKLFSNTFGDYQLTIREIEKILGDDLSKNNRKNILYKKELSEGAFIVFFKTPSVITIKIVMIDQPKNLGLLYNWIMDFINELEIVFSFEKCTGTIETSSGSNICKLTYEKPLKNWWRILILEKEKKINSALGSGLFVFVTQYFWGESNVANNYSKPLLSSTISFLFLVIIFIFIVLIRSFFRNSRFHIEWII